MFRYPDEKGKKHYRARTCRKEAIVPKVTIAQNILAANDTIAEEIQELLVARGIRTINVMSSPGAGKTTLLERTIDRLHEQVGIAVTLQG